MNEIFDSLRLRKSCRVYEERPISPDVKAGIVSAALEAPTAGNMALYSILDITDQAIKDTLVKTCDNQPFIATAPLVLVFCADYQRWYDIFLSEGLSPRHPAEGDLMLSMCDALIAAQNTVVAAEAFGLGSCYIGDIIENFEIHRELFKLPKYVLPVCMLCYGYPTKQQTERVKPARPAASVIVHENAYNHRPADENRRALADQQNKEDGQMRVWLEAFCKRKYNSDFSLEMSRSARAMIKSWCETIEN